MWRETQNIKVKLEKGRMVQEIKKKESSKWSKYKRKPKFGNKGDILCSNCDKVILYKN